MAFPQRRYKARDTVVKRTYIHSVKDGENEVEIKRDGEIVETVKLNGGSNISRRFDRGYYTATLIETGAMVEFCVYQPEISHTVENGVITVKADSCDENSEILYMDFREFGTGDCAPLAKIEELSDEEKRTGVIVREIPEEGYNFKVYFENKYGVWTHQMINCKVKD